MMAKKRPGGRKHRRPRSPVRIPKQTVLIVCEGGETEPVYFEHYRRNLRKVAAIEIVPGYKCGSNPKSVVEYAKRTKESSDREYDQIWCVFDRDQHERIPEAFIQARDNGFEVAFSNPCFEIWILLHFKDQTRYINRDETCREIRRNYINDYEKSQDVYPLLLDKQNIAIERAEKLKEKHERDGTDILEQNPCTDMYKMVIYLNSIETKEDKKR